MDDVVRKPGMALECLGAVEIRNGRGYTKGTQGVVVTLRPRQGIDTPAPAHHLRQPQADVATTYN
jgi:hypothetical protein